MQSFKRRQVYVSRRLTRQNQLLTAKYKNCIFKTFKRCRTFEVNAKTLGQSGTVGLGTFADTLTVTDIFLADDLLYIRNNYANAQILSLVIRIQLQEIINGQIIIASPATGYENVGSVEIGDKLTPRIYVGLQIQNQDFPDGPTELSDTSFNGKKPLWVNCPSTKTMKGNKVTSLYWNCPKPARSNKHPTKDWGQTASEDSLSEIIDANVNQVPLRVLFFWADMLRYQYGLGVLDHNTKLVFNTSYTMYIKLCDSHAWRSGTSS